MSILGAFNSSWSTEPSWKAWTLSEHFDDDFPDGEDFFAAKEQDAKKEELCLADKYTDNFWWEDDDDDEDAFGRSILVVCGA